MNEFIFPFRFWRWGKGSYFMFSQEFPIQKVHFPRAPLEHTLPVTCHKWRFTIHPLKGITSKGLAWRDLGLNVLPSLNANGLVIEKQAFRPERKRMVSLCQGLLLLVFFVKGTFWKLPYIYIDIWWYMYIEITKKIEFSNLNRPSLTLSFFLDLSCFYTAPLTVSSFLERLRWLSCSRLIFHM